MQMPKTLRSQAAIDYMTSYGIALLVVVLAVYIVLSLGVFNLSSAPLQCVAAPGFGCSAVAITTTGNMTVTITQATGAALNVQGVACSTQENATNNLPAYGNIHVVDKIEETATFYWGFDHINQMPSGSSYTFQPTCWSSTGINTGNLGQVTTGYIWINYTNPEVPTPATILRVAQFTEQYT